MLPVVPGARRSSRRRISGEGSVLFALPERGDEAEADAGLAFGSLCGAGFAVLVGLMTWRCVPVMTGGGWVGAVCLEGG